MFPFKLIQARPPANGGKPCYYATSIIQETLAGDELLEVFSERSRLSEGECIRVLLELSDIIAENIEKGNSVTLPNLGTLRPALKSLSVAEEKDFRHSHIQKLNINFSPHKKLKSRMIRVEFKRIK